jgi:ribosome-binding factor A
MKRGGYRIIPNSLLIPVYLAEIKNIPPKVVPLADQKSEAVESTESTRQKKVARLIQKEIADIFLRKGSEYAPGKMISITKVRVSPDLSFAKVFISIFPSENHNVILNAVQAHASKIRFDLGHKVRSQLRIVPDIAFFIDDSLDYIEKIDKLLKS